MRMLLPWIKTAFVLPLAAFIVSGCVARAVGTVVTAPVKVAGQGVDWATTSRDEADRNRGREMRKRAERDRKACRRQGYDKRHCAQAYPDY